MRVRPIEDGLKGFTLAPDLGSLDWVSVSVPTPQVILTVDVENSRISVDIPEGAIMELYGDEFSGPQTFRRKLK